MVYLIDKIWLLYWNVYKIWEMEIEGKEIQYVRGCRSFGEESKGWGTWKVKFGVSALFSTCCNCGVCHPWGRQALNLRAELEQTGSSAAALGMSAGEPNRKRSHEEPGAEMAGTEESEDPWVEKIPRRRRMATHPSILVWKVSQTGAWQATVHGATE